MENRYRVTLTDEERAELSSMVSKGKSNACELVLARILLLADQAAEGSEKSDPEIVEALGGGQATVERVRRSFVEEEQETANVFMAVEPLAGKRTMQMTDRRPKVNWALFIKFLLATQVIFSGLTEH